MVVSFKCIDAKLQCLGTKWSKIEELLAHILMHAFWIIYLLSKVKFFMRKICQYSWRLSSSFKECRVSKYFLHGQSFEVVNSSSTSNLKFLGIRHS